jgi:Aspartate carbamoyltransferase, catalytic chain
MVKKIWNKRSLIGVKDLSSEEINFLLDTAAGFKDSKRLNLLPSVSLKAKK